MKTLKRKINSVLISTCFFLLAVLPVLVVPVNSYANIIYEGSEYQLVVDWGITWENAEAAAVASGWHLATITSAGENAAVYNNLVIPQGPAGNITWISYWIGGYQDPLTEQGASNGWTWVTGEPWSYTNWNGGEPNDAYGLGSEQFLEMILPNGQWNDESSLTNPNPAWTNGYIAERSIPEPSSFILFGAGLAGVAFLRRRTQK